MKKPKIIYKPDPKHNEMIRKCVELHHELMGAGLYATGHKMHEVVQKIGYEVEYLMKKNLKCAK